MFWESLKLLGGPWLAVGVDLGALGALEGCPGGPLGVLGWYLGGPEHVFGKGLHRFGGSRGRHQTPKCKHPIGFVHCDSKKVPKGRPKDVVFCAFSRSEFRWFPDSFPKAISNNDVIDFGNKIHRRGVENNGKRKTHWISKTYSFVLECVFLFCVGIRNGAKQRNDQMQSCIDFAADRCRRSGCLRCHF